MVWLVIGIILLEVLLRTAGAAYLLLREHQDRIPGGSAEADYSVLCLGESTTAIGGSYSWPSQLEAILNGNGSGRRFKVINGGVEGTNTAFILSRLETDLERYKPDIVITMMGSNDIVLYAEYKGTVESKVIARLRRLIYEVGRGMGSARRLFREPLDYGEGNPSLETTQGLQQDEVVLKEAVLADWANGTAYIDIGSVYEAQVRYPEAIETYETLLNLSQAGVVGRGFEEEAYVRLGRLYCPQGKFEPEAGLQESIHTSGEAEEMFKKALQINPANSDAYQGLGWLYFESGFRSRNTSQLEESGMMFRRAIELYVPHAQIYEGSRAYEGLGQTYEARGMFPEAIGTYETLLNLSMAGAIDNEFDDMASARLAGYYHKTGVSDEEIEEFYKSGGLSFTVPQNASVHDITKHHYRELYRILHQRGVKYITMQYPTRDISDLRKLFDGTEDILFVSNRENFQQALWVGNYRDYFIDRFAGTFGHATSEGNRLIAENVANVILTELEVGT